MGPSTGESASVSADDCEEDTTPSLSSAVNDALSSSNLQGTEGEGDLLWVDHGEDLFVADPDPPRPRFTSLVQLWRYGCGTMARLLAIWIIFRFALGNK